MTHNELASSLAAHLRGSTGYLTWEDMQMGPSGSPRPDVFCIEPSYTRFIPKVYEVKVSRSDFLSDVTSGKWQSYSPFASAIIFATRRGLIAANEVPAGCGLIQLGETWRMVKRPTLQKIETLPHVAWMKLMIDGIARQVRGQPGPRDANMYLAAKKLRAKHGELIAKAVQDAASIDGMLEHARLTRDAMRIAAEDEAKRIRARAEQEHSKLAELRTELCQVLGLTEPATRYSIETAIWNAAKDKWDVVSELHKDIENALMKAKEHALAREGEPA